MRATVCFAMFFSLIFLASSSAFAGDPVAAKKQYQLGEKLRSDGDLKLAVEAFKKSYQLDNNYEVLLDIGRAEAELEHYDAAVVYLETHLKKGGTKIDGGMKDIIEKEIKRLKYLISMGLGTSGGSTPSILTPTAQPSPATPATPAVEVEPATPPPPPPPAAPVKSKSELLQEESNRIFASALISYESGDFEGAMRLFKNAYQVNANFEAFYYIGECALVLKDYARAMDAFERYVREGRGDVPEERKQEVNTKIADIVAREKRVAKRLEGIEAHNRGVRLNRQGRFAEAMVEFAHASSMFPDYRIQQGMGNSAAGQKKYELALGYYGRYLSEGGNKVSFEKATKTEEKIERIKNAMVQAVQQSVHDEHLAKAKELVLAERLEDALTEFNLAFEAVPNAEVLLEIGQIHISLKQFGEAIATFNRYLDENADKMSEEEIKKIDKRIESLERTDAKSATRAEASAHLAKGNELKEIGAFEEAIPEMKEAYELDKNYEILLPLAECYAGVENYKLAVKTYNIYLSKGGSRIPDAKRKEIRAEAARLHKLSKEKKVDTGPDLL